MLNKKFLAIASLVLALSSTSVFAKTEGSYAGIDILRSDTKIKYKGDYSVNGSGISGTEGNTASDSGYGLGAHYKYASRLGDDTYIAPGVFIEANNLNANDNNNSKIQIKNRAGVGVDLGYDIDNNLSVYATGGASLLHYTANVQPNAVNTDRKTGYKPGWYYGVGLLHNYSKNVATSLEFTTQSVDLKVPYSNQVKNDLRVVKLGVAYRF